MTTVLSTFLVAFLLALFATPIAKKFGVRIGAMDMPDKRKVHTKGIPRSGGSALFVCFFVTLLVSHFFYTEVSNKFIWGNLKSLSFFCGAIVIFGIGFVDDFHPLSPKVKLLFQLLGATIAFFGGIRIEGHVLLGETFHYGVWGYFVTVFWFILFINAVNLIDGLDGLAAGIVFFTSLVMTVLLTIKGDMLTAMLFAILGGTLLGFLRYNFNPATIFMGDGGSYFLGYVVAAISIMGSAKGQTGALILMPLIGMGVPLFDALLAPLRRFILGKGLFQPDKSHIHHQFMRLGFNARKAVLMIYGISIGLCLLSIVVANIRDEMIGLFLVLLVISSIIFFRKLKYFEYFTVDKVYGWIRDVTDVSGIDRKRRSFLNLQMEIENSMNYDEMWSNICLALEMIKFTGASLCMKEQEGQCDFNWLFNVESENSYDNNGDTTMKIDIPLMNGPSGSLGKLVLTKDLGQEPLNSYTIRRVEHLRRAVQSATSRFEKDKNEKLQIGRF